MIKKFDIRPLRANEQTADTYDTNGNANYNLDFVKFTDTINHRGCQELKWYRINIEN